MSDAQVIDTRAGAEEAETDGAVPPETVPPEDVVLADLLVEEVSIDGMCGVY